MAGIVSIYKVNTVSAGLVGLSLSNAVSLSLTMLQLARASNELEIELNSLQRILQYTDLESEKAEVQRRRERLDGKEASEKTLDVSASWPSRGEIQLKEFSAAYTENGVDVIKKMNLTIRPGERLGVVGRTGSGKTSLTLSLLRFTVCTAGSITIDGVDISKIDLTTLRRQVTLIPQEPILFAGDVRTNLDIFDEMDNSELEQVLSACSSISPLETSYIKPGVPESSTHSSSSSTTALEPSSCPTPRLTLSTPISRNGDNLSRGERQIISMARALCRRSKIVLLDEATSSVDERTDTQIQEVLRTGFSDSTVITIAHRLKTVMDYDRVMVLSEGEIVECGTLRELVEKRGMFWRMLRETGEEEELVGRMKH